MTITLTHDQIEALVAFANENDREGGTTAWGPKFNAVMKVAQEVRSLLTASVTSNELAVPALKDAPKPVSIWQISGDLDVSYITWTQYMKLTSMLPTQRWKVGRNGDALIGYANNNKDTIAVLRIDDALWWEEGHDVCMNSVLKQANRTGIID